jgi:hypothetical protein
LTPQLAALAASACLPPSPLPLVIAGGGAAGEEPKKRTGRSAGEGDRGSGQDV